MVQSPVPSPPRRIGQNGTGAPLVAAYRQRLFLANFPSHWQREPPFLMRIVLHWPASAIASPTGLPPVGIELNGRMFATVSMGCIVASFLRGLIVSLGFLQPPETRTPYRKALHLASGHLYARLLYPLGLFGDPGVERRWPCHAPWMGVEQAEHVGPGWAIENDVNPGGSSGRFRPAHESSGPSIAAQRESPLDVIPGHLFTP